MSRVNTIFGRRARLSSRAAPSVNREGYPAWIPTLEAQYLQVLMTNTFGQTFYADSRELVAEANSVHDSMIAKDPDFAAAALVYARSVGCMRTQPIFGLVKLAAAPAPYFEAVFDDVIRTPNDLADFVVLLRAARGGEGGRRVKRVVNRWLTEKLDEYWVIKYGSARKEASLANILRAFHPPHRPLFSYLRGREVSLDEMPKIRAFEALKVAPSEPEKLKAIRDGRLPHEVVTPFARNSKAIWRAMLEQMPLFALLRNLAALERHGVLAEPDVRRSIEARFTDAKAIRNSKILPFRFLTASEQVSTPWVREVLRDALELAFVNLPTIYGRTAVFLDISGSMSGRFLQVASIFAISLMKQTRLQGRLLLFDTEVEELEVSMRDSILSQASKIKARGGTDTSKPLRQMLLEKDRADTLILITDEQQNAGAPFFDVLSDYRKRVNRNVRVFIIDVAPYRNALAPEDLLVHTIYGWSDKVLELISMTTKGWTSMAQAVRASA